MLLPPPLMANGKNKRPKKQDSTGRPSKKPKTATPASEEPPKAPHPRPRPIKRADRNVAKSDSTTIPSALLDATAGLLGLAQGVQGFDPKQQGNGDNEIGFDDEARCNEDDDELAETGSKGAKARDTLSPEHTDESSSSSSESEEEDGE